MVRKKRSKRRNSLIAPLAALDLMLAGNHDRVIGPDFILQRKNPFNADIGHLNPEELRRFDQEYINSLFATEAANRISIPVNLEDILESYLKQRMLLSKYDNKAYVSIFNNDVIAAKELKNYDEYIRKVVIRNDAERNVFYNYLALYRKIKNKRAIIHWRLQNPTAVNAANKALVDALEKSEFAILRLDENLSHGGIRVTNVITHQELLLIDKALNASNLEGCFFICSLLDMGDYVMTSGGGIPIDSTSTAGKSTLSLSKKHMNNLRKAKTLNNNVIKCVREIYGFCLRSGAMTNMTMNEIGA